MNVEAPVFKLLSRMERVACQRRVKLYVVGGALRDPLLGRQKRELDFDFALKRGACSFGRYLSAKIACAYVLLDKEHGACRLIRRIDGKLTTFDFTDFRASSIEDDLRMRDFTANALAVPLRDFLLTGARGPAVIDPLGGVKDLTKGVVRACSARTFRDDPLRILRAFSLAALFGWAITAQTRKWMRPSIKKLTKVSAERIRDEFFKILESARAAELIEELDAMRILSAILPEIEEMRGKYQGPYHHLDIWKHSIESVRRFEGVVSEFGRDSLVCAYLNQSISGSRSRKSLILFACLLHDIGKPRARKYESGKIKFHGHENIGRAMAVAIGRRLKLSVDEINALSRMVQAHLRPGSLAENRRVITPRAVYRFFRDTAEEAPAVLLLSLADQRATRGRLTTAASRRAHEKLAARLLKEYFRKKEEKKIPRLLNGHQLMKYCKLTPSPLVGRVLLELDELQAIGKLRTPQQARKAARVIISRERDY